MSNKKMKLSPLALLEIAGDSVCQRKVYSGTIVLQENFCYFFQGVEQDIWENLAGRSVAELIEVLSCIYEVDASVLRDDVSVFLSKLMKVELIEVTNYVSQENNSLASDEIKNERRFVSGRDIDLALF